MPCEKEQRENESFFSMPTRWWNDWETFGCEESQDIVESSGFVPAGGGTLEAFHPKIPLESILPSLSGVRSSLHADSPAASSSSMDPLETCRTSLQKSLHLTEDILSRETADHDGSASSSFPDPTVLYFLSLLLYHEYTTHIPTTSSSPVGHPAGRPTASSTTPKDAVLLPYPRLVWTGWTSSAILRTHHLASPVSTFTQCERGGGAERCYHRLATAETTRSLSTRGCTASSRFPSPWQQACKMYARLTEKYTALCVRQEEEVQRLRATHEIDGASLVEIVSLAAVTAAGSSSAPATTINGAWLAKTARRHQREMRLLRRRQAREEWSMTHQFQKLFAECIRTLVTQEMLSVGCHLSLCSLWEWGAYLFGGQYGVKVLRRKHEETQAAEVERGQEEEVEGRRAQDIRNNRLPRITTLSTSQGAGWSAQEGTTATTSRATSLPSFSEEVRGVPMQARMRPTVRDGKEKRVPLPVAGGFLPLSSRSPAITAASFSPLTALTFGRNLLSLIIPFYEIPVISVFVPCAPRRGWIDRLEAGTGSASSVRQHGTGRRKKVLSPEDGPGHAVPQKRTEQGPQAECAHRFPSARQAPRDVLLQRHPFVLNISSVADLPWCLGKTLPPSALFSSTASPSAEASHGFTTTNTATNSVWSGGDGGTSFTRHLERSEEPSLARRLSSVETKANGWRASSQQGTTLPEAATRVSYPGGLYKEAKPRASDEEEEAYEGGLEKAVTTLYADVRLRMISAQLHTLCVESLGMLFLIGTLQEADHLLHTIYGPELLLPLPSLPSLSSSVHEAGRERTTRGEGMEREEPMMSLQKRSTRRKVDEKGVERHESEHASRGRWYEKGLKVSSYMECNEEEEDDEAQDTEEEEEAHAAVTHNRYPFFHSGWKRVVLEEEEEAEEGYRMGALHMCTTTRLWGVHLIMVFTPPFVSYSFCTPCLLSSAPPHGASSPPLSREVMKEGAYEENKEDVPREHKELVNEEEDEEDEKEEGTSVFARRLSQVMALSHTWGVTALWITPLGSACRALPFLRSAFTAGSVARRSPVATPPSSLSKEGPKESVGATDERQHSSLCNSPRMKGVEKEKNSTRSAPLLSSSYAPCTRTDDVPRAAFDTLPVGTQPTVEPTTSFSDPGPTPDPLSGDASPPFPPALWMTRYLLQEVWGVLQEKRETWQHPLYGARMFLPAIQDPQAPPAFPGPERSLSETKPHRGSDTEGRRGETTTTPEPHPTKSAVPRPSPTSWRSLFFPMSSSSLPKPPSPTLPSSGASLQQVPSDGTLGARETLQPLLEGSDVLYLHFFLPIDAALLWNSVPHTTPYRPVEEVVRAAVAGGERREKTNRKKGNTVRPPCPATDKDKQERNSAAHATAAASDAQDASAISSPLSRSIGMLGSFLHLPFSSDNGEKSKAPSSSGKEESHWIPETEDKGRGSRTHQPRTMTGTTNSMLTIPDGSGFPLATTHHFLNPQGMHVFHSPLSPSLSTTTGTEKEGELRGTEGRSSLSSWNVLFGASSREVKEGPTPSAAENSLGLPRAKSGTEGEDVGATEVEGEGRLIGHALEDFFIHVFQSPVSLY